jgi:hypothetical protein
MLDAGTCRKAVAGCGAGTPDPISCRQPKGRCPAARQGGIRKLRWKREGSGKSGGVRVIYYFHDDRYPLFLLTLFGKSEKANISKAERNILAKLSGELLNAYRKT